MAANLGTASGRIEIDGSGATQGFSVAQAAADSFFSAIQSKIGDIENMGRKLQGVGAVAATGFGLAVNSAANFEAALDGIQAVSGATEQEMEAVSAAALRIGKDTSFSASEAAAAFEEIIKAGVSVEDALNGAADATVALAAAGGVSLPEAATIASNALNNFNLKGKDMTHVADLIAGAANASAIDVGEFGQALSQSGAVANLTGTSFDDLAVAIAEMGQAGIKGSDAGTSIKTFLTNLIPTTADQTAEFKRLGLMSVNTGADMAKLAKMGIKPASMSFKDVSKSLQEYVAESGKGELGTAKNAKAASKLGQELGVLKNNFFDAKGNVKDFASIQGELAKAMQGMTKEQKLASLELLFGSDAIRAAAVFADQGAEGFNKMATAMGKVSAADVAKTRLDNLKGAIEEMKGSLETAAITIGSVFLPIARKIVEVITSVVNAFNNMPPGIQKAIAIVIGVTAALAALVGTLLTLLVPISLVIAKFAGFALLKSIFSIFTAGFGVLRSGAGVMAAVAATAARAGVVFSRLGAIGRVLFGVISRLPAAFLLLRGIGGIVFGPIGLAISLVVTALTILYNRFAPFRELVNGVASAVQTGLVAALNYAKLAMSALAGAFREGDVTSDGFIGVVERLGAGLGILWRAAQQVGSAFMGQVVPALKAAGALLKGALLSAWQQISAAVSGQLVPALRALGTALAPLLPYLAQFGMFLLKVVGFVLKVAAAIVGGLLLGLLKLATLLVGTVIPAIIRFGAFILSAIIPAIAQAITWLIQGVAAIINFAAAIISGFTGAKQATTSGAAAIGAALQSVIGFFVSVFTAVKTFLVTVFTSIWTFITTTVTAIATGISTGLTGIKTFFTTVFTAIWSFLVMIWTSISTAVMTGITAVKNFIMAGVAAIQAIWTAFWTSSFGMLVQNAFGLVVDIVKLAIALIQAAIAIGMAAIRVVWNTVWNGLVAVVTTVWAVVKSVVLTAFAAIRAVVVAGMAVIRSAVQTGWNAVRSVTSSVVNAVRSVVSSAWNAIRSVTSSVWNAVSSVISSAWGKIRAVTAPAVNAVRSVVSSAWNAVRSVTTSVFNAVASVVTSVMNRVRSVVTSVASAVRSAITSAWNAARSATVSIWNAIYTAVSGAISKIMGKVRAIKGQVISAFAGAAGWLLSAGAAIVSGLISGISSKLGAARAKVQELAAVARDAAKAALKIGSPSKVFKEIGKWVGVGFVKGLQGTESQVSAASKKMADLIKKGFKGKRETSLLKAVSRSNTTLVNIARDRVKIADRIKAASERVNEAVKLRDDYARQTSANIQETGNLTNFQEDGVTSSKTILDGMKKALGDAVKFQDTLAKLKAKGLSAANLQDIVDKGVEAGGAAGEALLAGGASAIKAANWYEWKLRQTANNIGTSSAGQFYGAGVAAAQGLLQGLNSQQNALIAQAKKIATAITNTIKKALKIKSPSRVMAGLGENTLAGFIEGLRADEGELRRVMQNWGREVQVTPSVAGMLRPVPTPKTTTQRGDQRPTVHQDIKIYNPERVRDSADIDNSLQLAGAGL